MADQAIFLFAPRTEAIVYAKLHISLHVQVAVTFTRIHHSGQLATRGDGVLPTTMDEAIDTDVVDFLGHGKSSYPRGRRGRRALSCAI